MMAGADGEREIIMWPMCRHRSMQTGGLAGTARRRAHRPIARPCPHSRRVPADEVSAFALTDKWTECLENRLPDVTPRIRETEKQKTWFDLVGRHRASGAA